VRASLVCRTRCTRRGCLLLALDEPFRQPELQNEVVGLLEGDLKACGDIPGKVEAAPLE
jgi:hypothetical protein